MNGGWRNFDIFPSGRRENCVPYDRAFRIDRRVLYYFFLSSLAFYSDSEGSSRANLFAHRPVFMIDCARDKRESTVLAIIVIILAFV